MRPSKKIDLVLCLAACREFSRAEAVAGELAASIDSLDDAQRERLLTHAMRGVFRAEPTERRRLMGLFGITAPDRPMPGTGPHRKDA